MKIEEKQWSRKSVKGRTSAPHILLNRLRTASKSKFARNVAIVAMGTAGAQAIAMAFAPVITRMYGPEAFGLLGTFTAILGIVTPLAALSYPIAIVLPKSDGDAVRIAKLSAFLALIMASVLAVLLLLFGDGLAMLLNLNSITSFLLLIPLAMVFSAFQQTLQQWLIRKKQFRITARIVVINAFVINTAKVGAGWFYPLGAALIVLAVAGSALHAYLLWLGIRKEPAAYPTSSAMDETCAQQGTKSLPDLARKHRDFPQYRAPQIAINAMSASLPVLLLASFFGATAAGFYTLSRMVMGIPSTVIGKSVGDVFYPRIAEAAHNKENLFPLILKATQALAVIGAVPFGLIVLFGPWLFSLVFGQEWEKAGEYARWLAVWLYFGFINKPAVAAVPTLRMQPWLLVYEIFSTGTKVAALFLGFYFLDDDLYAIALMCIFGVVAYAALITSVLKRSYQVGK